MPSDTLSQSLNAGQWAFINTVLQRVIAFGTFFILARILLPSDFGIIALLTVVPSFIEGVTALAFDTAVVQKQGDIRQYLNAIWTFTILRGLIIFLIVFAVSPFIADFFHITYALPALRLAGLGIFLNSLVNIGQTYFFIELDFKKVFIRDMVLSLSYSIAAISLALVLHSYWALFIGNILSILAVVVATYVLHPYRPRFDLSFSKLGVLLPFSKWLLGQELLNQLVRTAEDSLMGRFTTPMALGLYGKAKSLAIAPTAPLSSLIGKVGFTSYTRRNRQDVRRHACYLITVSLPDRLCRKPYRPYRARPELGCDYSLSQAPYSFCNSGSTHRLFSNTRFQRHR
jgi:O-antigen/teichoic acid export membrane protein